MHAVIIELTPFATLIYYAHFRDCFIQKQMDGECARSFCMRYYFYIYNIAQNDCESNEKCIKLTKKI